MSHEAASLLGDAIPKGNQELFEPLNEVSSPVHTSIS